MKKQLLVLAWEYDGYHSLQGAALSRRVRQVAESFVNNAWRVTVIHKDQRGECGNDPFVIHTEPTGIRRIIVKSSENRFNFNKIPMLRKIQTFYYVTFHGDRSNDWANNVIKHYNDFGVETPGLIISFFSPRGPLFLGNYLSAKLKVKWIADLQDNFDHGMSRLLKLENKFWTKNILKSAHAIVHVSTEWAARDGKMLGYKINVIRHAVPGIDTHNTSQNKPSAVFKIFYGGSLNEHDQSLAILKSVFKAFSKTPKPIELLIAGTRQTYNVFNRELGNMVNIINLGWLDKEAYKAQILNSDCSLVIPWSTQPRQVIPSKFYELCGFHHPIWIVGKDTGAFGYLLTEWQHPAIPFDQIDFQKNALLCAMNNDFSLMFQIDKCRGKYIKEGDLFEKYIGLI